MIKAINCKQGSAWHSWQIDGAKWARESQTITNDLMDSAAASFSNASGWPSAAKDARYVAFIEGVKLELRGL